MSRELVKRRNREFARAFGANLARLRLAAGLSQEELGFRSEVHRTSIGPFERGEQIARADTAVKLCIGLGVQPNELFAGISWAPPFLTKGHPVFDSLQQGFATDGGTDSTAGGRSR
jgi:transcriptional regulator with XRE-family HTH domain